MSHTRASREIAEHEAEHRTLLAKHFKLPYRFEARRYPNGTDDIASWPWGVARLQIDYYPEGWAGSRDRFDGYVWERN